MDFPILDGRTKEEVYEQLVHLAKGYVPEWKGMEDVQDYGHILTRAFMELHEENVHLYHQMPNKNLIYFLNLLGADRLPPVSSKGSIRIDVNEGVERGVQIAKGSGVYGYDENGERVLFEVQDDITAVDNELLCVYAKSTYHDKIMKVWDSAEKNEFSFFDFSGGANLQQRALYIGDVRGLFIGGTTNIILDVVTDASRYANEVMAEILGNTKAFAWCYLTEFGWQPIEKVETKGSSIVLELEQIPLTFAFGEVNHWISCQLLDYKMRSEVSFQDFRLSSMAGGLSVDAMYYNDISLEEEDCLPFGTRFSSFDDFYIKSDQVFTKSGANICLEFDLEAVRTANMVVQEEYPKKWKTVLNESDLQKPKAQDITISRVKWEYYNGNGWASLYTTGANQDFFKEINEGTKTLEFVCPDDLEGAFVGADYGFWIRGRILEINNMFQLEGDYVAPRIKKLSISYGFSAGTKSVETLVVEKDMQFQTYGQGNKKDILFYQKDEEKEPTMYLKFKNNMPQGVIKMNFEVVNKNTEQTPVLKWEYFGKLAGKLGWHELVVLDETKDFSKSGIVTFVCNDPMDQMELFGETGYWIRLVNVDCKYDTMEKSLISVEECSLNVVSIVQKEELVTKRFFMTPLEKNKKCPLYEENVVEIGVWVDEIKAFLKGDFEVNPKEDRAELDANGNYIQYWKKWKQVNSLYNKGAEERVFTLEDGVVCFGDNVEGKIPEHSKTESIWVEYATSFGSGGNFEVDHIEGFTHAAPFITKVVNAKKIAGGCDKETTQEAIWRNMSIGRHQNKIVSMGDFAECAKYADRNVVETKIKAMSGGGIELAILPKEMDRDANYFNEIKGNIMEEFQKKAPITMMMDDKIRVVEVDYIEFEVHMDIEVESYNDYQYVYTKVEQKLSEFLNPITGNFNGRGFGIGNLPKKNQIYSYLRNVDRIKGIKNFYIFCNKQMDHYKQEVDYESISKEYFAVPVVGTHKINIQVI